MNIPALKKLDAMLIVSACICLLLCHYSISPMLLKLFKKYDLVSIGFSKSYAYLED